MKQFFKFLLATVLGFFVAAGLCVLILAGVVGALIGSASKEPVAMKDHSVLELKFDYPIPERSSEDFSDIFGMFSNNSSNSQDGLKEILQGLKDAADNEHVKGIYLHLSYSPNDYATLEEIRNGLIAFKKSGKFIIAYGEFFEEHAYYLASVADKVYLNPTGELLFNGFSYSSVYLKGMLEKIGVEAQLIRHGKFKAAGEPFIANEMSKENREQISTFMGSLFDHYIAKIAESRKKTAAEVKEMATKLTIRSADDAVSQGMIDGLKYQDEIDELIRKKAGTEAKKDLELVTIDEVSGDSKTSSQGIKEKIAVIYASGEIVSGSSDEESMGSETICKALVKARKDSTIKAVVLRINSPGGSALASDVIWREVVLTRKAKPVVVSMGAVAASGGYYIAAPATRIFAEPNTITGSIGVFGLMVNAQKLLSDKLGLKFEKVNMGDFADMGSIDRPLTAQETEIIQQMIDRIYDDFITRVSEGRKISKAQVDSLAQGRVWTGVDALSLKLVDELGGIEKAIQFSAKVAKLGTKYKVVNLPEQKNPFESLMTQLSKGAGTYFSKQYLGEEYAAYRKLKASLKYNGILMRMPFNGEVN